MRWFAVAGVALAVCASRSLDAQAPPGTDVYLAPLEISHQTPTTIGVGSPVNITNRAGYDNQPAFFGDERAVFYTSIRADGQADIYRYEIASKQTTRVTTTTESEYSPTPMPGGKRFSVIRVEPDSTQRLWSFALDGSDPQLVLRTIKPVGYQAWMDDSHVAVFVLGQPATLQVVDIHTEHADTAAKDIDRSLSPVKPRQVSFVQRGQNAGLTLERLTLGPLSDQSRTPTMALSREPVAPLPQGAAFVVWTEGGVAVTASGSKLYTLKPGGTTWDVVGDFAKEGLHNISRLAISPNGHWIALVADDTPAK